MAEWLERERFEVLKLISQKLLDCSDPLWLQRFHASKPDFKSSMRSTLREDYTDHRRSGSWGSGTELVKRSASEQEDHLEKDWIQLMIQLCSLTCTHRQTRPGQHDFTTMKAHGILPHWLDACEEEVKVGIIGEEHDS